MQNYHADLVWKIDYFLVIIICCIIVLIFIYLWIQDLRFRLRRRRLINIKNDIYKLLSAKKDLSNFSSENLNLSPQQLLDVVTNRQSRLIFFNSSEQEYIKNNFVNQENILKIERIASRSWNKWRCIEAILALGYLEASSALPIFEKNLYRKDADISYYSLLALGQIRTFLSERILLNFLKNNSLWRQKVATLLESFPADIINEVIKLTDDPDPQVRFWALKIASRFNPSDYIEKIIKLAHDKATNVRAMACECLGNIKEKRSEEVLINSLGDDFWLVRLSAAKGLANLATHGWVGQVIRLLRDNSLNVIAVVKDILIKNIDLALPYLEKVTQDDDEMAKKIALEIISTAKGRSV